MINNLAFLNVFILSSMFCILLIATKGKVIYPRTIGILMLFIGLLLIQILFEPSEYFSQSMAIEDIQRFVIYSIVILVVSNCPIRQKTFTLIWGTVFVGTLLVASLQFFKIFSINNLLEQFYGGSRQLKAASYNSLERFRGGSVFVNANSYAKFILMYLSILLCLKSGERMRRKIGFLFSLAAVLFALILSGSRTGLVIATLLFVVFLSQRVRKVKVTNTGLIIIMSLSLLAFFFIFAFDYYSALRLGDLRLTKIRYGIEVSLNYKYEVFKFMIGEFETVNVFLGLGRADTIWGITTLDFDIGYLISFYGLVGVILYSFMLRDFWNFRSFNTHVYKQMNKMLVVVFLLFGFTGGLFFNLRIFTILSTMLFADVVESRELPEE